MSTGILLTCCPPRRRELRESVAMVWLASLPDVPDLTQPRVLSEVGSQALWVGLALAGLLAVFGLVIAALQWRSGSALAEPGYGQLVRALPQTLAVISLVWVTFLVGSTLAVRYHDWEQTRLRVIAQDVSGDRLEQRVPRLRYTVKVPIRYTTYVNGLPVDVTEDQEEYRYLFPVQSDVLVDIAQDRDPSQRRFAYTVAFQGSYRFVNPLANPQSFDLEIEIPTGYTLVQSVTVTQDGQVQPLPGEPRPSLSLNPGQSTRIAFANTTQGGSRWIYDTEGQLLSQFRLVVVSRFANPQFASGVVPSRVASNTLLQPQAASPDSADSPDVTAPLIATPAPGVTTFLWEYGDNVAVRDPFGVFTPTTGIRQVGVMPRLLLLSPVILLGWLILLSLSGTWHLRETFLLGGSFLASLFLLTYGSRIHLGAAFLVAATVLLLLVAMVRRDPLQRSTLLIPTLCAVVLPTLALIIPWTGITLALTAVLTMAWLLIASRPDPDPETP